MAPVEIKLADHTIRVVGQKHAYLLHEVPKFLAKLPDGARAFIDSADGDLGDITEQLPGFLGEHVYEALALLIPGADGKPGGLENILPEHEFRGFATREAMDAGEYDPAYDKSPSFDEIVGAFEAVIKVNRFEVFRHVKDALGAGGGLDPTKARSMISPSSPRTNGASAPTSSGTTPPTSDANAA